MILKIYVLIALGVLLPKEYVVCYQGTWATYRQSNGKYDVNNIDPFLCTHLVYAFFGIEESGELRVTDPALDLGENDEDGYISKFNALCLQNPTLKTIAAVGDFD
ncbi:unnamed protein product [Ceratitis capitata]|uniref:(Mediterranean fruit fly) hypothetical protein n=1 Tax=Ceratitis capitata TaxID=7213 RepID=A0A811UFV7_CERCA|nr:unnamed protein product [Ceratitis capitata]